MARDSRGADADSQGSGAAGGLSFEAVRRPVHACAGGNEGADAAGFDVAGGRAGLADPAGFDGADGRVGLADPAGFDVAGGRAGLADPAGFDGAGGRAGLADAAGFDGADGPAGTEADGGGTALDDAASGGDAVSGGGVEPASSRFARFLRERLSLRAAFRGSRRGGNSSSVYILGHPVGEDSCELRQGHAHNRTEIRADGPPVDSPAAASPGEAGCQKRSERRKPMPYRHNGPGVPVRHPEAPKGGLGRAGRTGRPGPVAPRT
jgi:hypothetical protein